MVKDRFTLPLQSLAQLLRSGLDVLAPPRCMGCFQEGVWLCRTCRPEKRSAVLACPACEKPSPRGLACTSCHLKTALTGSLSAGSYGNQLLRRGIHWLKFKGVRSVAAPLAELLVPLLPMVAPLAQLQTQAVFVPIPLHRRRLRQRGFNQSEDIARQLAVLTAIPYHPLLVRHRSTWTQKHLPRDMRLSNMSGAFAVSDNLPDRKIFILVDDVSTSGATMESAAEALQAAGASAIWSLTVARG